MSQRLPEALQTLIDALSKLPGLGPKSALRLAMTLLKWPESETRRLGNNIAALRDSLNLCSSCGAVCASDPCEICGDEQRDRTLLCVVPEWDSMLAMENGGFYNGLYLILGGLISAQQKVEARQLEIERLMNRLDAGEIREVILALGATLEAENTASYLKQLLAKKYPQIMVTRLAQGIPLGGEVKHMDKETLRQSMRYRQEL